jgi:hypothetical protein
LGASFSLRGDDIARSNDLQVPGAGLIGGD